MRVTPASAPMADVVHEHLRNAILSATVRPNQRLVEEEIAGELAVSRTPVREALQRLRHEGLVAQNRGWIVRDNGPEEVLQAVEARAGIESFAASLAAERITEADLARLKTLLTEMESDTKTVPEVNTLNIEFHTIITEAAGNSLLTQFSRRTQVHYWSLSRPVRFTEQDDQLVNRQHRALYQALERRDGAAAREVAQAHVETTYDVLARAYGLPGTR